ncbi:MAG: 2Fe-2S iron-sulfur cluster binding domain-containing protein [Alphaproteobacteria bacterium]|nr:2Fe-2S iron-sulfur cluster binding domain-containing protein [Alphaproteobacteria bacterium]
MALPPGDTRGSVTAVQAPRTVRGWKSGAAGLRQARVASGAVLFSYVALHLLNHSLGLVSLQAAADALLWLRAFWRSVPGTVALYGALLVHGSLALWAIYQRRRLRMPPAEWARLILGLAIVPLMALHVTAMRLGPALFGVGSGYVSVLLASWVADPWIGLRQGIGLLAAWTHGCLGLHLIWRLKPWYPRWSRLLFALALLLPVLALLGFVDAGREVERLMADPDWLKSLATRMRFPDQQQVAAIYRIADGIMWGFAALVAGAYLARAGRSALLRRKGFVRVTFPDRRVIEIAPGASILDASRQGNIPHAEVCGGRGRCSTCRVRVSRGLDSLPPPSDAERRVLERISAAPNVRLACQTRPASDVTVMPLLPPSATARDGLAQPAHMPGQEREIAILFADLRAFTQLSEHKLPYDVVFLLNRYFSAMGGAVEKSGGRVDKFIGDGVMALFGVGTAPAEACRQALAAARAMAEQLDALNQTLAQDLDEPLRIGIGLHVGPAIVGEMGYGSAVGVTAIGDAVNTASRLEGLTKEYGAQLVLSEAVAERAGADLARFERQEIAVRGRQEMLAIRVVREAKELPTA